MYKISQTIIDSFKEDYNENIDSPDLTRYDFLLNVQGLAFLDYIEKLHSEIEMLQTNRNIQNRKITNLECRIVVLEEERNRAYKALGWNELKIRKVD